MIKLNIHDGGPIWVNPDYIIEIRIVNGMTEVRLTNGSYLTVTQSPEQIQAWVAE